MVKRVAKAANSSEWKKANRYRTEQSLRQHSAERTEFFKKLKHKTNRRKSRRINNAIVKDMNRSG